MLPCNIDDLPNDVAVLKKMVMKLVVRSSDYELTNHRVRKQLKLATGPNKYI